MSEPAVRAELQITLKDGASAGLKAIADNAEKSAKKISDANEDAAKKYVMSQKDMTAAAIATRKRVEESQAEALRRQEAAEKTAIGKYAQNMEARRTLGMRSENEIQKEIKKTEDAYKKLAGSGVLSAQQQERALDAMKRKVTALTNEMGKLTAEQKKAAHAAAEFEKVQSRIRTGIAITAGVGAAAYTLSGPAKAAMSFDERLANMANTAYAERDAAGRKIGMGTLEGTINKSTQPGIGGGTREQAAEALDAMIAKNTLGYQRSMDFLPTVMRTASGTNADPTQIANLASVLVGQKVVSNDRDLKTALNMITSAGQAGGFEIKDMARWLSQQMPLAGKAGMMGLDGLQKVLTMNQAAVLTAGTTDEAGNNVKNLLAKGHKFKTKSDTETIVHLYEEKGLDFPKYLRGMFAVAIWDSVKKRLVLARDKVGKKPLF